MLLSEGISVTVVIRVPVPPGSILLKMNLWPPAADKFIGTVPSASQAALAGLARQLEV